MNRSRLTLLTLVVAAVCVPSASAALRVGLPVAVGDQPWQVTALEQGACILVPATIPGTPGDDNLVGTPANDVIVGLAGNDTIDGGGGDDLICGGEGNDIVNGSVGDDFLSGELGDDTLDGGPGEDLVFFLDSPAPIVLNLTAGSASGWGTDIVRAEGAMGSIFADSLTGDGNSNFFDGFLGNDSIVALGGVDVMSGDEGNDVLNGGAGPDLAMFDDAPRAISASLTTRRASGWGADRLQAVEALSGSRFGDRLTGNGGVNILYGNGGNDILAGLGGGDGLFGAQGRDKLDGGRGRDQMDGGPGRDVCLNGERNRRCP